MKKKGRGKRWAGGYIHHESDGRPLFIIERQVAGRRFHISTRCNDEGAAMKQFARFQADPTNYSPTGIEPTADVVISVELISEFREWHLAEKKNTNKYCNSIARKLGDWMVTLGKRDLRKLALHDLKELLKTWPTERQRRVIAIKIFFHWLRKEKGLVTHSEDPTLDLAVPQGEPAKWKRKKATDWQLVRDTFPFLSRRMQDVMQFFAATGWHITEVERFVRRGDSSIEKPVFEVTDPEGRKVLGVLITWHKTKKWTRTSIVHQAHLDAIQRLLAEGTIPRKMNEQIAEAVAQADAARRKLEPDHQPREPWKMGWMRHTVSTWAGELGDTAEHVAQHLDHADKKTTERFYLDHRVPKPAIRTRVLQ